MEITGSRIHEEYCQRCGQELLSTGHQCLPKPDEPASIARPEGQLLSPDEHRIKALESRNAALERDNSALNENYDAVLGSLAEIFSSCGGALDGRPDQFEPIIFVKKVQQTITALEREVGERWQPIETAPKDGTEILAFRKDAGIFAIHFVSPFDMAGLHDTDPDWFTTCGEHIGHDLPTHWMPLPNPPTKSAARDPEGSAK